jgi:hypothetical protein
MMNLNCWSIQEPLGAGRDMLAGKQVKVEVLGSQQLTAAQAPASELLGLHS